MTKYDPDSSKEEDLEITRAWDDVQREFNCCGVNNYTDWTSVNGTIFPTPASYLVPASCCNGNATNITDCLQHPNAATYESQMNGCFTVFKKSLINSKSTIEIVTGTIIAVMVWHSG